MQRSTWIAAVAALLTSCGAALAAETSGAAVRPAYDTQAPGPPLLSADEAAKRFRMPLGFAVQAFAAEPMVRQPIGLTIDGHGRLWIAENDTYAEREVNFASDQRDRVVILEDTNHDGRADRRTVFWDQAERLTSVEVGFGGVWLMCPPKLLFIPDRNGDDQPDGEPEVLLDGFNADSIRHNLANGLRWGPDGWLYGRHGIQATSLVGSPGSPPSQRTAINCCLWRFHPVRRTFEVVATGGTNCWGFDYDQHGEMFLINTVIGHLYHAVPGAHYERMYGADLNPHVYALLPQTADHYHFDSREKWSDAKAGVSDATDHAGGGHAHCGLLIYQGDNWPEEYRGSALTVNLHGLRLNQDHLRRRGNGFVATHGADLMRTDDPWFRGIELVSGPDGSVYVADWCDIGECHENDGVHRSSGRIYRVTYQTPRRMDHLNIASLSDEELAIRQTCNNDWFARQARHELQQRAAAGRDMSRARTDLVRLFNESRNAVHRLRAMWALYSIGAVDETWLRQRLADDSEHVRVWAIRLLGDAGPPSDAAQADFVRLARDDRSGLVRLYLASALQRLPAQARWPLAQALATHEADAADRVQPLLLWYGIEPAVPGDPSAALGLLRESRIPIVRRHVARRLTVELIETPEAMSPLVALAAESRDASLQRDVLEGMAAALDGWRKAPVPPNFSGVAASLANHSDKDVQRLARDLSVVFGDGRALDNVRSTVFDAAADPQSRRQALRVLVEARAKGLGPQLLRLVNDRVLANEAVRGLAYFAEEATPKVLLEKYRALDPTGRSLALDTLSTRREYAAPLLAAVDRGEVAATDISGHQARQIYDLGDEALRGELRRLWGEARPPSEEKRQLMERLRGALTTAVLAEGDLAAGQEVFKQKCANCHTLFGQGGKIGPDLTGGNRTNLDYLLENIIDPSATVAANFRTSVLVMTDGRVLTGVVLQSNERTIDLQTPTERLIILAADVEEIVPQNLSLMPDSLLTGLSPEQVRDLFGYLSSRR